MASDIGQALAAIDEALRERPHVDGHVFSVAAQQLCAVRDRLAAERGADRRDLDHVNAVISVVLACHFPLGGIPWDELEKARDWLAGVGMVA